MNNTQFLNTQELSKTQNELSTQNFDLSTDDCINQHFNLVWVGSERLETEFTEKIENIEEDWAF